MQIVKYDINVISESISLLNELAANTKMAAESPLAFITALSDVNRLLQTGAVDEAEDVKTDTEALSDLTDIEKEEVLIMGDLNE